MSKSIDDYFTIWRREQIEERVNALGEFNLSFYTEPDESKLYAKCESPSNEQLQFIVAHEVESRKTTISEGTGENVKQETLSPCGFDEACYHMTKRLRLAVNNLG